MPYIESEHKARLRKVRNGSEPIYSGISNEVAYFDVKKDDFHWLVGQAEEIGQVKEAYEDRVGDIESIQELVDELKKALSFYADHDNNLLVDGENTNVSIDGGKVARQALRLDEEIC